MARGSACRNRPFGARGNPAWSKCGSSQYSACICMAAPAVDRNTRGMFGDICNSILMDDAAQSPQDRVLGALMVVIDLLAAFVGTFSTAFRAMSGEGRGNA